MQRSWLQFVCLSAASSAAMLCTGTVTSAVAPTFVNVADTTTNGSTGAPFTNFDVPANDSGTIAFHGTDNAANLHTGIYVGSAFGGAVTMVADVASTGGTLNRRPAVSGTTAALSTTSGNTSLFTADGSGPPTRHLRRGDPAPVGTFGAFIGDPAFGGSTLAQMSAFGTSGVGNEGVFAITTAGVRTTIARDGDVVAGFGMFDEQFGGVSRTAPDVDGSTVAFMGKATPTLSQTFGIFAGDGATPLTTVVKTGDPAPLGTFRNFATLSIADSTVGFFASYNNAAPRNGLFSRTGAGPIIAHIEQGDPAPVGTFAGTGVVSVGAGPDVALGADYGGTAFGLFLSDGVTLTPVLLTGDNLFGSTVTSLRMSRDAYDSADGGTLAFAYGLADGRQGIGVALLPEPGAGLVMGLIFAGTVATFRRRR